MLREFRDRVLMNTYGGRKYIILFYKHSPELTSILLLNPSISAQSKDVLNNVLQKIKLALEGKDIAIAGKELDSIVSILDAIGREASPALQESIQGLKQNLKHGEHGEIFNER